jgi:hypothetical protein
MLKVFGGYLTRDTRFGAGVKNLHNISLFLQSLAIGSMFILASLLLTNVHIY